jgi:hypothetical protein
MLLRTETDIARRGLGLLAVATLVLLTGMGGCGRKIGDGCSTSVDCDPNSSTRTCDLSQPGGYCLIEGCDDHSCPEDSFCARFFPATLLTSLCSTQGGCAACTRDDDCAADELCLTDSGWCARRSWESRVCVQSCSGSGDCRARYVCKATGTGGVIALTLTPGATPSFCAPGP